MRRLALITVLLWSLPASAGATVIGRALKTAASYWGPACSISVELDASLPTAAIQGTEVEAWVTFTTPEGETDFKAQPSTYSSCMIHLNPNIWPNEKTMQANWAAFCQVMIHEYGHFEGWADSTIYAPTDIRFPLQTAENMPNVCKRQSRRILRHFER